MKILTYVILLTMISIATDNIAMKNIEAEIYKIKDFDKYQDARETPKQEFIGVGSIEFLGWSKQNHIAYLVENSIVTVMSDSASADLIIYDTINNKIVYSQQLEYEDDKYYPKFNGIYPKYKKEITKILNTYSIVYQENISIKSLLSEIFENKNMTFTIKKSFKKTDPIGFGNYDKYLHQVDLHSKINAQTHLCKKEIFDNGDYPSILNAKIIGVLPAPNQKTYAVIIAYVHTNGAEGNSVDMKLMSCKLNLFDIRGK